jgi:hypothetical protein
MQHNLLKKYEDEVNSNAVKQDLINHMKIELDQYEAKCKSYESDIQNLHVQLENVLHLEAKQKSLLLDLESYKIKCEKYKKSLKYFDDNFFNEIENLKHMHDEAVKLNKYYEHLLFRGDRHNLILKNLTNKKPKNRVKFAVEGRTNEENMSDNHENEGDFGEYDSIVDKSLDLLKSLNSYSSVKSERKVRDDDVNRSKSSEDYQLDFDQLTQSLKFNRDSKDLDSESESIDIQSLIDNLR